MSAQPTPPALVRRAVRAAGCATLALVVSALPGGAQRADSASAAVRARPPAARDTVRGRGAPISPRRALLRSLLVPGWGQSSLDRGTAGALFMAVELLSAAMIVKSAQDLDFAKRYRRDSIIAAGEDGQDAGISRVANPLAGRVNPRRQHLEDWIALLAFNHLFAGADAFVAAQLWDVPARVSVRRDGDATRLTATVRW